MKRNTNSILMLAYITFIFVAVFTKRYYDATKWGYIIAAITVASWVIVLSDLLASMATLLQDSVNASKGNMQSLLFAIRQNKAVNNRLNVLLVDESGNSTGKTVLQALDAMEQSALNSLKTIKNQENTKPWLDTISCILLYAGFVLFFCTLLFNPAYGFFSDKLDGMSALAFGTILAGQFGGNTLKARITKIEQELTAMNDSMKLLNESCEREAKTNAD